MADGADKAGAGVGTTTDGADGLVAGGIVTDDDGGVLAGMVFDLGSVIRKESAPQLEPTHLLGGVGGGGGSLSGPSAADESGGPRLGVFQLNGVRRPICPPSLGIGWAGAGEEGDGALDGPARGGGGGSAGCGAGRGTGTGTGRRVTEAMGAGLDGAGAGRLGVADGRLGAAGGVAGRGV